MLAAKNIKISRPVLFNYIYTREEFELYMNELFQLLETGKLKTSIYKIYPLQDIQQAHKVSLLLLQNLSQNERINVISNLHRISKEGKQLANCC